jgi:HSP20 family protein
VVKNARYYYTATSIYPGIYQPDFSKEQEVKKIKGCKPPVNIMEFPDHYEVEMPVPGFQKEDLLVKTLGCSLLIAGYKKCSNTINEVRYHQHDFRYQFITSKIDLPGDADTEFGTAEFKNGILYIYLYKTSYPVQNRQNFIIVY